MKLSFYLGKQQELLDIIEDYRNLRNQIHLPGDIVEYNNQLIDKWKLNVAQKVDAISSVV